MFCTNETTNDGAGYRRPLPNKQRHQQQSKQQSKKNPNNKTHKQAVDFYPFPTVPDCVCGAKRMFEFQFLPSMLHVLDVDSANVKTGGMNWGSIAVYSCPESCDDSREEFLIVQNGDDAPVEKKMSGNDGNGEDNDDNVGMDDN